MATDLGTRIKRARERKRWSQQRLADALGVDRKTVDNWENGRTKPRSSVGALEEVLGVSLAEGTGPEADIMPPGLREHVREIFPDRERAERVEAAIEAALRGETPQSRGPNGPRENRAVG
ncbi:MAG TPA: helix-turn-helix transcriptional regulator [Trebonia sp.]|jgi:transcriptional regulator with XRE-family HTH domain